VKCLQGSFFVMSQFRALSDSSDDKNNFRRLLMMSLAEFFIVGTIIWLVKSGIVMTFR